MPRYELAAKFWDIKRQGTTFLTNFGKIGSPGQTRIKEFDDDDEAKAGYAKAVADKLKEGYKLVGGKAPKTVAAKTAKAVKGNAELEKAIEANPTDEQAYSVYADWLQDQGDPRGELIALSLANKGKQVKALLKKHADAFLGPLAEHQKTYDGEHTDAFTWKYGFIHAVRLSHNHYANEEWKGKLADVLELLLAHPSGRFLTEMTFVFNNDPSEDDLQDLIDVLAKKAPKSIRSLFFGDYEYCGPDIRETSKTATGNTEISWYAIGNLAKLWKAAPNLERLITQSGSYVSAISGVGLKLGKIDLPNLRHAEFRTGGLDKANAKAIAAGKFPQIEHLEIWYGDDDYGGDATVKDVAPLLARTDLPKLRRLGLCNALFTDELPALLAKSKLVKQLKVLDLGMGCLTDDGAQKLAEHADAFAHLDLLDVTENYLTKTGIAALKGIAKKVDSRGQREMDAEYRFPSVGE